MYLFKRKYKQIKRTLSFIPIIWRGHDFDYGYAIELFRHQLKRTADLLESKESYTLSSETNAQKIRTAIRLMDKVYEDAYAKEWMDTIVKIYGKDATDFEFEDTGKGDGSSYLKFKYEKWDNAEEIKQLESRLFTESQDKQRRAHKLLWDFIEHNIQRWWD